MITAFFECPVCRKPVGAWFRRGTHGQVQSKLGSLPGTFQSAGWGVQEVWPTLAENSAPEAVPLAIARNFLQAEEAARRGHNEAAGMAYRRALELALKEIAPEAKGTPKKRIDDLATKGRLTKDVAEWAHSVREIGNEAAHDEDEPTSEDIADLSAFMRVLLEYLYTMPEKVKRRATPTPDSGA